MPERSPSEFLFPLESEMWRVNHQRCGLFFGAAAAVLQIAHPRIARGVADHSQFSSDSLGRLRRTLGSTNAIAFGTVAEAQIVRRRVAEVHRSVKGRIPSENGQGASSYSAFEPDLLLWVLATMIMAAVQGYELVSAPLNRERKERFYREMREFGVYFGLREEFGPRNFDAFKNYYDGMIESDWLGSDPLCAELARAIVDPRDSAGARLTGAAFRFLPLETLPAAVREKLGLGSTRLTRGSMAAFRRLAPLIFPCLPRTIRWFPEARKRIAIERNRRWRADPDAKFAAD